MGFQLQHDLTLRSNLFCGCCCYQERRVSRTELDSWFQEYTKLVRDLGVEAWQLFNLDETFVSPGTNMRKVVLFSGERVRTHGVRHVPNYNEHITLIVCVAADGSHLIPGLIFPLVNMPQPALSYTDYFTFSGSKKGWINKKIFAEWTRKIFIPEVRSRREKHGKPEAPFLLLLDSHSSRANPDLLEELMRENIVVFTFPSHCTHILQPLDMVVFSVFKSLLTKELVLSGASTADERRSHLLVACKKAIYIALYEDTVKAGFKRSGLFPPTPSVVLDENEFVSRGNVSHHPTSTRTGVRFDGRVLTSTDFIAALRPVPTVASEQPPLVMSHPQLSPSAPLNPLVRAMMEGAGLISPSNK